MMKRSFLLATIQLLAFFGSALAQEIMPLDEIQPGMMGHAKTVLQGDSIEEFEVEIIDILHNFYPKRNVILVRLKGEKVEQAGPTQGMSGSPVYVNGKLIGALAYGFSLFPKDPIMGVTPIGEMLEIFDRQQHRKLETASAGNSEAGNRFLEVVHGFSPPDWQAFAPPASLQQIDRSNYLPVPLALGGFGSATFALASEQLQAWGLQAVRGAGSGNLSSELVPGAPVAAVLINGDFDIAATGTVTYRDGDRILAFGHPFFDNGPVELPIAPARILATLTSQLTSTKLSASGPIVGTLLQDRTTGVMGQIGPVPPMTRVKMRYHSQASEAVEFQFGVTQERTISSLAPLLLRIALINGLESARLSTGFNTLQVKGSARTEDGTEIQLDNLYPGYQPLQAFSYMNSALHSTGDIAAKLAALTNNSFKEVTFTEVNVEFTSIPGRKSADLEDVWVNRARFSPGDTLEVFFSLRPHKGEPYIEKGSIVVPRSVQSQTLTIVVGGAMSLNSFERRITPDKFTANSYQQLVQILQNIRENDKLYVQMRTPDRGVILNGDELPGLPPSLYPALTSSNGRSNARLLRDRVVSEIALPQPVMVEGIKIIRLRKQ